jgi:rhodanese-related sulfurtransferase
VFVYDEGFPAWSKRGYPFETLAILPKVKIPLVSPAEVKAMIDGGESIFILDLRDEKDRKVGWIGMAVNIVLEDLMARYTEIPRGKKIVVADLFGKQTQIAGRYLLKQGYTDIVRMEGGMKDGWLAAGYPTEK